MKTITLEFTPWQIKLLIKILKNYLNLRKKIYWTWDGGLKQFTHHPEAIVIQGLIPWMEEKLVNEDLNSEGNTVKTNEKLYLLGADKGGGEIELTLTKFQVGFFYNLLQKYTEDNAKTFPTDCDDEMYANDDQVTVEGLLSYFFYKYHELEI